MDGETSDRPPERSGQPGGRRPAPGELAVVQAFVNTHFSLGVDYGADLLATPAGLRRWLVAHGLIDPTVAVTEAGRTRAVAAREALRQAARAGPAGGVHAAAALDRAARGAPVGIGFGVGGPLLRPAAPGLPGALGLLMAITARAMIDGSWARLKVCPGEDCGWAFYDHSRNQTGRWCSMALCGGRAKARAHYRRRRAGTA